MSKQTKYPKYRLLGVEVDAITAPQAVDYLTKLAADPKSAPQYVVKPYVEFMDKAAVDSEIAGLLNQAELCLPDGVALVWGAHYLHGGKPGILRLLATLSRIVINPHAIEDPLPQVFRGVNFTLSLIEACAKQNLKLFLIGSPQHNTIADTAAYLKAKYPSLELAGHFTGTLNAELETELVKKLQTVKPDVILVGIGFPAQEQLMARLQSQLDHGVMVGEGGSFDYASLGGKLSKAPRWMQRIGLEWLWRLILQPWRLKRQLAIWHYIRKIYQTPTKIS